MAISFLPYPFLQVGGDIDAAAATFTPSNVKGTTALASPDPADDAAVITPSLDEWMRRAADGLGALVAIVSNRDRL